MALSLQVQPISIVSILGATLMITTFMDDPNRDIGMGSIIVMYAGQLLTNVSQILMGKSQDMQETLHRNFLALNQTHTIDVPRPYDNLSHFRGTFGHKANHNFTSNARFGFVKSPR